MSNLIDKLKKLFGRLSNEASPEAIEQTMNDLMHPASSSLKHDNTKSILTESILKSLMQQVEQTKEGVFTCEETYDLLDEYVDLIDSDQDAARLMPLVKAHLDMCQDCTQKYEILLDILKTNFDEA